MPIDERSISLPEQWAKDAQTVIPAPPVPGIAYRNTAITPEQWAHGQDYSRVADSAQWNQMFWTMSGLLKYAEQYGIMPYSPSTDYPEKGWCMGSDGVLYQALQPSGPTNGGPKPTSDTTYWSAPLQQPNMSPYGTFTNVDVLTTSGIYVTPVEGWYFLRCIGGGGGGGKGGSYSSTTGAEGGFGGGATSIIINSSQISAIGGGGGSGGGASMGNTAADTSGGGGGGMAGTVTDRFVYITKGISLSYTIGAGGPGGTTTFTGTNGKGRAGTGTAAGREVWPTQGGTGAAGAGTGCSSSGVNYSGCGGAGGVNHTGFGGGGGGGGGGDAQVESGPGGAAYDGGSFGANGTPAPTVTNGGNGGNGGTGAIFVYYQSEVI